MKEPLEGQVSLFGADMPFTRMSPERCPPITERTGRQSSRRSSGSSSLKPPMFLSLTRGGGRQQGASAAWERTDSPFPWLGESTTLNFGASRKDAAASACWLTSPGLLRLGFCLTLNLSERPRQENPSKLSEILVTDAEAKYRLSQKACQGILNRAERRGKELPPELKAALIAQSAFKETGLTEATPQDATAQDGAGGGCYSLNTIDRPAVVSFRERAGKDGGGKGILLRNEQAGALSSCGQYAFDNRL